MRGRPNNRGFTLLELLVVMVLMALIAGVVVPAYSKSRVGIELRKSTRQVANILRESRSAAMLHSQTLSVRVDRETHSAVVEPGIGAIAVPADFSLEISGVTKTQGGPQNILFYPDGSSSGGQVTLASGPASHSIVVDWLTGAVSIE